MVVSSSQPLQNKSTKLSTLTSKYFMHIAFAIAIGATCGVIGYELVNDPVIVRVWYVTAGISWYVALSSLKRTKVIQSLTYVKPKEGDVGDIIAKQELAKRVDELSGKIDALSAIVSKSITQTVNILDGMNATDRVLNKDLSIAGNSTIRRRATMEPIIGVNSPTTVREVTATDEFGMLKQVDEIMGVTESPQRAKIDKITQLPIKPAKPIIVPQIHRVKQSDDVSSDELKKIDEKIANAPSVKLIRPMKVSPVKPVNDMENDPASEE